MKSRIYVFGALAIASIGLTALFFQTLDIFIALACAAVADAYVYAIQSQSERKDKAMSRFHFLGSSNRFLAKRSPSQSVSTLLFIILVVPLVAGSTLDFMGLLGDGLDALARVLLIVGFAITFFFASFSIPLALRYQRAASEATRLNPDPKYRPLVSILAPAYNEQAVISGTLEALINTKYEKKEIIAIDDGSTDKTSFIMSWYKQFGVKVLRKPNGGKASALNYGLLFATGEIIITVDADTQVTPDAIDEIVKVMSDPSVSAVSGNVKVLNNKNMISRLQELEYITNINILRRALDLFGAVMVVPGAFGAFRRDAVSMAGRYDIDTLAEDFDLTVKLLKAFGNVKASSTATAFTEVPSTVRGLYRQRRRWTKGIYQTVLKHKDAFSNERYGYLQNIVFPILLLSLIMPFAGFVALGSGVLLAFTGRVNIFFEMLALFALIQLFVVLLSIALDDGDYRLAFYTPLFVIGYKQFLDYTTVSSIFQVDFGIGKGWTKTERVGGTSSPLQVKPRRGA